jgi:hypothetical protein
MKADAGRAPGRQLAMHNTASGHDFGHSGTAGFWSGQQGIRSDIEAPSDVAVIWSAPIAIAADGVTTGAINMLTIARMNSRRGMRDQSFTPTRCHMMPRKRSAGVFTFSKQGCDPDGPRYIGKTHSGTLATRFAHLS